MTAAGIVLTIACAVVVWLFVSALCVIVGLAVGINRSEGAGLALMFLGPVTTAAAAAAVCFALIG
ncbi:hypothetical protein AB0G05_26890 [Nonomuraea wenchangensis]